MRVLVAARALDCIDDLDTPWLAVTSEMPGGALLLRAMLARQVGEAHGLQAQATGEQVAAQKQIF